MVASYGQDVGRRRVGAAFLVAVLCVAGVGGTAAFAQIETAPPGIVPEFETPAPTPVPTVATPAPTLSPLDVDVNVGGLAAAGLLFFVVALGFTVLMFVCLWRLFTKAGEPGWASIVPIYNSIVLLKISGKPWWWILILWLVIPAIIAQIDLAHNFGKTTAFGVGLILLPFLFFPILAFGDAQYQRGPESEPAPVA